MFYVLYDKPETVKDLSIYLTCQLINQSDFMCRHAHTHEHTHTERRYKKI